MNILIVEDEPVIARYILRSCKMLLDKKIQWIRIASSIDEAKHLITKVAIDLCLLDLNLNGEDGLLLLEENFKKPFKTIIITADTDLLSDHEDTGLDVICKPFEAAHLAEKINNWLSPK